METEREFLSERANGSLHTESVGDYILPDYNTDVKRVLLTRAEATDTGCFINGDAVDVTGVVNYEVVYIDSDNELTSCKFSTDYDASVKCNGESAVGCEAYTRVCGYSARLVGPRRFSVKAQLVTDVNITERSKMTVEGSAFALGEPETRVKRASVAYRAYAAPSERRYNETVSTLDGVIADDVVVLYSDVYPEISASAGDGVVDVGGTLRTNVLIKQGDEVPRCVSLDIPVSESLVIDGMGDGASCTAHARVNGLRINVEPTEDGVSLVADFGVEYSASAISNADLPIVLDCYLTDREVENTYESFSYTEHLGTAKINDDLSFTTTLGELGADSLREILLTNAYMRVDEVEAASSCAKMSGVIRFSGVACQINDDGTLGYVGIKHDAPFSINVNFTCQFPGNTRFCFNGGVRSASAVSTAEGVEFNAQIYGTLGALGTTALTRLSASDADGEPVARACSVITVYYPVEGETLFEVGRKFHTRPIDIAADNSLTEEVFSADGADLGTLGVKRLVIR